MNATHERKDEKLFSLVASGKTDFVIFSFSMTENPSNYGHKKKFASLSEFNDRIPSFGFECGDQFHFI